MKPEAIGHVTQVRCRQCREGFPVFSFSTDTDMPVYGLVSLTRTDNKNIAIAMALPSESVEALQKRIGPPYSTSQLLTTQHPGKAGASFQEFRKSYRPPTINYSCIFCAGTGDPVGEESVAEFESHNKIEVFP